MVYLENVQAMNANFRSLHEYLGKQATYQKLNAAEEKVKLLEAQCFVLFFVFLVLLFVVVFSLLLFLSLFSFLFFVHVISCFFFCLTSWSRMM